MIGVGVKMFVHLLCVCACVSVLVLVWRLNEGEHRSGRRVNVSVCVLEFLGTRFKSDGHSAHGRGQRDTQNGG